MTISAPTFTRLQTGVTSADDLRVRNPVNAALAWLSGDLVTQLNTHFGAVSNSISARIATLLATANTWTAAQTIQIAAAGTALTLRSTDAGAGGGPQMILDRNSATPAANDQIGAVVLTGRNSIGGTINYTYWVGFITDPSNGSEDGRGQIRAMVAGVDSAIMLYGPGVQIGSPTGGDQGAGTLNLDNALFRDGTQVVGTRVTGWGDPFGAVSRATFSTTTATTNQVAQALAALITDLKAHGLIGT